MSNKFYIVPLFLTIFSIIVIGISLQLDTSPEMIVGDSMQARSFPIFLMVLNLILISVLTFQYKKNNPEPIKLEKFLQISTPPKRLKNACYFYNKVNRQGKVHFISYHHSFTHRGEGNLSSFSSFVDYGVVYELHTMTRINLL